MAAPIAARVASERPAAAQAAEPVGSASAEAEGEPESGGGKARKNLSRARVAGAAAVAGGAGFGAFADRRPTLRHPPSPHRSKNTVTRGPCRSRPKLSRRRIPAEDGGAVAARGRSRELRQSHCPERRCRSMASSRWKAKQSKTREEPQARQPQVSARPSTLVEHPIAWDGVSVALPGESLSRYREAC